MVPLDSLISDNLLSPFELKLPAATLPKIERAVKLCSDLRENPAYQKQLKTQLEEKGITAHNHRSIMMSYDFHADMEGNLKLIEVNTNASFLILGTHLYETENIKPVPLRNPLADLKSAIEQELNSMGINTTKPRIAIVDEKPEQQRLYIEFVVAKALFESWGWTAAIKDSSEVNPADYDFIYNRDTDFFLENTQLANLRSAAQNGKPVVSPHPAEYFYLAAKERLVEWSSPELRNLIPNFSWTELDQFLLKSEILNLENRERLWTERKKIFFKPVHAFGAKSSFRGATISRGTYEGMLNNETLAQEFFPAPEANFKHQETDIKMKFDLRCYAYRDRLQMVIARLYQGQVTNLRTTLGGFSCVNFTP